MGKQLSPEALAFNRRLGARIAAMRRAMGYSQRYLTDLLGLRNRQYVSDIECGIHGISVYRLKQFSDALEIRPEDLLEGL